MISACHRFKSAQRPIGNDNCAPKGDEPQKLRAKQLSAVAGSELGAQLSLPIYRPLR